MSTTPIEGQENTGHAVADVEKTDRVEVDSAEVVETNTISEAVLQCEAEVPVDTNSPSIATIATKNPSTVEEYREWAKDALGIDFDEKTKLRYNTNISIIQNAFQETEFSRGLNSVLENASSEYYSERKSDLLMAGTEVSFVTKSYDSVVNKMFRKNVLLNKAFPVPPKDGWIDFSNCYDQLNDLIRATIVCKFIDGPRFVTEHLISHANTHGIENKYNTEQRDEGYYAFHYYGRFPMQILTTGWETEARSVSVEIQVTTQLQDALKKLTHLFYEEQRINSKNDTNGEWKWDYDSLRFRASYLSHTLHMLEGVIVELRNTHSSKA